MTMLANTSPISPQAGSLGKDVHAPACFLHEMLDFISEELPRWRDRQDRKRETSETVLTAQLCAHLTSAARRSSGWDILQFRTEVPDDIHIGRKIDLVPSPCDTVVWIEGRRYTDFESLMPIECKRLPTPQGKDRDEREYVFSQYNSTGGIQRFKAGHHGASHSHGAMIGYVQEETTAFWQQRVSEWIGALATTGEAGWSEQDAIHPMNRHETRRLATLRSVHDRQNSESKIELRHLWLEMN